VLKVFQKDIRFLLVRIVPENPANTLGQIEKLWRKYEPELPVNLVFFEKLINDMYLTESKLARLFSYGAAIAILISCMGLYGLTTFIAAQRSKEIAIRKSYGASRGAVLKMLVVEHLKLVLLANLITWPLAYFAMNRWLATFDRHIQLSWPLFVAAALLSIAVVSITVSYHALKTASANPVAALRYE
jgi:ABC-type antimicrobial peptide transport system permease subunit